MELWTAFTIGVLGSLHCIGMCGPIAFALPLNRENLFTAFIGSVAYNLSRIFGYASIGLVFGLIGKGFFIAGLQQFLSVFIGSLLLLVVIIPLVFKKSFQINGKWNFWLGSAKAAMGKKFGKSSYTNLVSIGLLNALLPCGLVYLALAGSTVSGSAMKGAFYMALFGLGTLPLMLTVSLLGTTFRISFKNKVKKLSPIFIIFISSMLIVRGLGLNIPYLSPTVSNTSEIIMECH